MSEINGTDCNVATQQDQEREQRCETCLERSHIRILYDTSTFLKESVVPCDNVFVYIRNLSQPPDEEDDFIKKYNRNANDGYSFFRFINENIKTHYKGKPDGRGDRQISLVLDRVPTEDECSDWFARKRGVDLILGGSHIGV